MYILIAAFLQYLKAATMCLYTPKLLQQLRAVKKE